MAKRSKGTMSKRSRQLGKNNKQLTPNDYIKTFEVGERVVLDIKPLHKIPHPRFLGQAATVTEKRGKGYMVRLQGGKLLTVSAVHLKRA